MILQIAKVVRNRMEERAIQYTRLFEDFASSIHKQIDCLQKYNSALAEACDLLLPQLLNVEIAA